MKKAHLLLACVLAAPVLLTWIRVFVLNEANLATMILAANLLVLISLAEYISEKKTTKLDKHVQTETCRTRDQSVQTEDSSVSPSGFEEVSEDRMRNMCSHHMIASDDSDEFTPSEERSSPDTEDDRDSPKKPMDFVSAPNKETLPGIMENDPVVQDYLQCVEDKHQKKKLPFFQRKLRKITKRFRKKKINS